MAALERELSLSAEGEIAVSYPFLPPGGRSTQLGEVRVQFFDYGSREAAEQAAKRFEAEGMANDSWSSTVAAYQAEQYIILETGQQEQVHEAITDILGWPFFNMHLGEGKCETDRDCEVPGCCGAGTCVARELNQGCKKRRAICTKIKCVDGVGVGCNQPPAACVCMNGTCGARVVRPR